MKIKGSFFIIILSAIFLSFGEKSNQFTKKAQIALCVDFSRSSKKISDAVRNNLFEFYTEFTAKYPDTKLELAIIGYSSKVFGSKNQYVQILSKFDSDPQDYFEYVNRKILTSSVSENHIGTALNVALKDLKWDPNPMVKKQIFTLGNGPIRDSYSDAKRACSKAKNEGITINILYIVNKQKDKAFAYWSHLAELSGGQIKTIVSRYLTETVSGKIHGNFKAIAEKNNALNATYIPFGSRGTYEFERMKLLDLQATNFGSKMSGTRTLYKASPYFQEHANHWDLVDYETIGKVNYNNIQKNLLPKSLRTKSAVALKQEVQLRWVNRQKIIKEINKLDSTNTWIINNSPPKPAYSLDLSSYILKIFTESGI